MAQKQTEQKQTEPKQAKADEVKTNSTVLIPVKLFYTRFNDLLDGTAVKVSTKSDGAILAVEVEKIQKVTA